MDRPDPKTRRRLPRRSPADAGLSPLYRPPDRLHATIPSPLPGRAVPSSTPPPPASPAEARHFARTLHLPAADLRLALPPRHPGCMTTPA